MHRPPRRGRLTVYLGAAPGVGKTYAMLDEAARRRARGKDVVVGLVETHGRAGTAAKLADLEVVPRRTVQHRGATLTELDVEAVLRRAPEVALVDELAHTNAPGSRHAQRWGDVHDLLEAGIDVVTTVNVQHLQSLTADVEAITGVRQRETVPDHVVREAHQIQLVDLSPEQLRRRLAHGNVYRAEQIDASLSSYFRVGNLTALRELALLWLADRVDDALTRYRADHEISGTWPARERVVVAITGGRESETLLRRAARIAQRASGSELLAVHVLPTDDLPTTSSATVAELRALTASLDGTFHTVVGQDVATAVVDFARGVNATMIVVGVSRHSLWRQALLGSASSDIARLSEAIDVHMVTHDEAGTGRALGPRSSPLSSRRRVLGWVCGVVLPSVVTAFFLLVGQDEENLASHLMVYLTGVVAVALVGGMWPALAAAVLSFGILNWFFTEPTGRLTIDQPADLLALVVFAVVAVAVASVVDLAARRAGQAYQARAEASSLSALARSVLSGEDTAAAIVDRIGETFAVREVHLQSRAAGSPGWEGVASSVRSGPGDVETEVSIDDDHRLLLTGRALPASDRQALEAFAAQAAIVLERRQLQERDATARALERAESTRTALLAAVSHDLRTPLSVTRAAVDGLAAGPALRAEDRDSLVATISESTSRLERLIGDLLDLSRLQTGAVRPVLTDVSLEEVLPVAVEPWLADLRFEVAEDLPLVRTDPGLLERVVANVVSNAVRHGTADEPVLVTASATAREVEVRVVDRGPGVPEDRRAVMFEPFQRLGTEGGLGLGLAVVDGLATAIGARVEPEDTPGGGLTMTVTLPRSLPHQGDA
ncbi:DUF4118 domain-containing protein [Serinicoccus sediminis]|uniref:DUF4118 domain-containing protein n=1 Tax=Serinicoccus sediminis TaxID=2306021 RepID=UPI0010223FA7|nr:DUF4118 domain-containing protein [Serinicoccus sediminis]